MIDFKFQATKAQVERLVSFIISNATRRDKVMDVLGAVRTIGIRRTAKLLDCQLGIREEVFEGPYFVNDKDDEDVVFHWTGVCTLGRYVRVCEISTDKYQIDGCYGIRHMTAEEMRYFETAGLIPEGWGLVAKTDNSEHPLIHRVDSTLIKSAIKFASTGKLPVPIGLMSGEESVPLVSLSTEMVTINQVSADDEFVEIGEVQTN